MNPFKAIREISRLPKYHKALRALPQQASWRKQQYGGHASQHILSAIQDDPQAPVAVWFHGGGWQFGSPKKLLAFGEYFWRRGYSVWMPSHRKLPRFRGLDLYQDAVDAMSLIQRFHAGIPSYLMGGMSSGGHLATLLSLRKNEWLKSGQLSGLLSCGAPLSLDQIGASPVRYRLAGRKGTPQYGLLDPVNHITGSTPIPTVIIHGTNDGLVPWSSAVHFVNEAKRQGWSNLNFISLPNGNHTDSAHWVWES